MRFSTRKRFRLATGALLLLLLISTPLAFGLWRPATAPGELPGVLGLYASGISSIGAAGWIALPLGLAFGLWLVVGDRRRRNGVLSRRARNRQNSIEAVRTLAIILGGAGIIVGSLSALYALLRATAPDMVVEPYLPLTFGLAIPCLLGGALAYTAGRFWR